MAQYCIEMFYYVKKDSDVTIGHGDGTLDDINSTSLWFYRTLQNSDGSVGHNDATIGHFGCSIWHSDGKIGQS